MKLNIDYYPHKSESHRHPKFKMLRASYETPLEGWASEGRFWALNNLIAQSENCILDLTKKRNRGVFADELGLTIKDFSNFIEILKSDDVELLIEIEPGIFTTETVQETFSSISGNRVKARERKNNSVKSTDSGEPEKSSGELTESSGDPNNKVKGSKGKGIEVKGSKERTNFLLSQKLVLSKIEIEKLFQNYTNIQNVKIDFHIIPVLEIIENFPKELNPKDVKNCVSKVFKNIVKSKGVRIDFLTQNIRSEISNKHNEILTISKQKTLKEAEKLKLEAKIQEKKELDEENNRIKAEKPAKIKEFLTFLGKNKDKFSVKDAFDLKKELDRGRVNLAEMLIKPLIEKISL